MADAQRQAGEASTASGSRPSSTARSNDQQSLGEPGRRVYEAMRAVDATIRVDVEGPGGGTFFLNIRAWPHERRTDRRPRRRFSR